MQLRRVGESVPQKKTGMKQNGSEKPKGQRPAKKEA
jgi:hypothetical protein